MSYHDSLERIYQAVSTNSYSIQVSGRSENHEMNIDFGSEPLIMDSKAYTIELLNCSFVNAMPNIKAPKNTIKYGASTLTLPTGRFNYEDLFEYIDTNTTGKVKLSINTITAKVTMINTVIVNTTSLLKDILGFPNASYAIGTSTAPNVLNIDDYKSVNIMCDQIMDYHLSSINGKTRRNKCMYTFPILTKSYATESLVKLNPFTSTLTPTYKLESLHFYLTDEYGRALFFGDSSSEFTIMCNIKRIS